MVTCADGFVKNGGRGYPLDMNPLRRIPVPLLLALTACTLPAGEPPATLTPSPFAASPSAPTALPPTASPTATPSATDSLILADRALLNGDYPAAVALYNGALAAGTESERAAFFLARALWESGDAEGARSMVDALLTGSPAGPFASRARFLQGEIAAAQGDWAGSVAAYQQFLALAPGLLNDIVQERVGDSSLQGGWPDQAVQAYAAAAEAASPGARIWLWEKQADTLSGARLAEPAIALYEQVLAATSNDYARARLTRKIGGALIALGRAEEGYARYEQALQYPMSHDAFLCLSELLYAGYTVDNLTRGIIDYYEGVYGTTLAVLTDYLAQNPAEPAMAHYFRGLAARANGSAAEAAADFQTAAALGSETGYWDAALFEWAYTQWAWLDDYAGAAPILVGLADAAPAHPRAAEALFTAARIAERGGDLALAAGLWLRMAGEYPADSGAPEARHQAGDYAGAEEAWSTGAVSGDGWTRSRALFWTAKAREKRGDTGGAHTLLEQAAAASPTDYYSERAADILDGVAAFTRVRDINLSFDLDAEYLQAEAWVQSVFPAEAPMEQRTAGVQNDLRLARGRILWDLGLYDDARQEFDSLWYDAAADPAGSLYLSRYFQSIGYYPGAIQAARKVLDAAGFNDAQTLSAPAYFSHVRFGPHFADLLVPQAANRGIDPLLLFALVRQESLFGVSAASAANAHGLMQLIPSTAEAMAARLGLGSLTLADLYRPVINVQLGSEYIAQQRDGFGGNLFLALAAYNGGPGSAAFWRDLAGGDDDLLVEVIRYEETRNYVRRIYENYVIYRDLYQLP
jgi:soluble lytic murein transglycosylase